MRQKNVGSNTVEKPPHDPKRVLIANITRIIPTHHFESPYLNAKNKDILKRDG
jgi:hypothetical protein